MYTRPLLAPVDATVANALCCHITVRNVLQAQTILCPFPTCGDSDVITTTTAALPCTVTVGPVTVSGN